MIEATFYIAQTTTLSMLNFEATVRRKIRGLALERVEMSGAKILYRATTEIPNTLLLLGAAILAQHEIDGQC